MKKHGDWLNKVFVVPQIFPSHQVDSVIDSISQPTQIKGRPSKQFDVASARTKHRKVQSLVNKHSPEQLTIAMERSLRKTGRRQAASVVKLAIEASPKSLKRMQKAKTARPSYGVYNPEQALALIADTNLTKENYLKIQRGAKALGANIYPSYPVIARVKQGCYPQNITITESEARISIQSLLDHTVGRLFEVQREVFLQHLPADIEQVDVFLQMGARRQWMP